MILIVCQKCKCGLRISPGEEEEAETLFGRSSDFFPDRYPCFRCGEFCSLVPAAQPAALTVLEIHDVSPAEAFAAFHGLGVPSEHECSPSALRDAFRNSPVKSLVSRPVRNSTRTVLEAILLEDGTKIYLGSSAEGAVVYRISKGHSYVAEVEHA